MANGWTDEDEYGSGNPALVAFLIAVTVGFLILVVVFGLIAWRA